MTDLARLVISYDTASMEKGNKVLEETAKKAERAQLSNEKLQRANERNQRQIERNIIAYNRNKLAMDQLVQKMNQAEASTRKFEQAQTRLASVLTNFQRILGATVLGFGIKQIITMADQYKTLQYRLQAITEQTKDYAAVSKELNNVSQSTGAPLEELVQIYQRLTLASKDLGKSNADSVRLTRAVSQLGAIGGASGERLRFGLTQFGQAMSSGVVRAEEFNSIVENLPLLAKAIADGMGTTVGQLRQMVIKGKVFSKDVMEAVLKQLPEIEKQFAKLPLNLERASNKLKNEFLQLLDTFNTRFNITPTLAAVINKIADAMVVLRHHTDDAAIAILGLAVAFLQLKNAAILGFLSAVGTRMLALRTAILTAMFPIISSIVIMTSRGTSLALILEGLKLGFVGLARAMLLTPWGRIIIMATSLFGIMEHLKLSVEKQIGTQVTFGDVVGGIWDTLYEKVKISFDQFLDLNPVLKVMIDLFLQLGDAIASLPVFSEAAKEIQENVIKRTYNRKLAEAQAAGVNVKNLIPEGARVKPETYRAGIGFIDNAMKNLSINDIPGVGVDTKVQDKAAESLAKKRARFTAEINAEYEAARRLLDISRMSAEEYQRQLEFEEAKKTVREKNLQYNEAEIEQFAEKIRLTKQLNEQARIQIDLEKEAFEFGQKRASFETGYKFGFKSTEFNKQELENRIQERLRELQLRGATPGQLQSEAALMRANNQYEIATKAENSIDTLSQEIKDQKALNRELGKGVLNYQLMKAAIEARKKVEDIGYTDSAQKEADKNTLQKKLLEEYYTEVQKQFKLDEVRYAEEIDNIEKLNAARLEGVAAYREALLMIQADEATRKQGLSPGMPGYEDLLQSNLGNFRRIRTSTEKGQLDESTRQYAAQLNMINNIIAATRQKGTINQITGQLELANLEKTVHMEQVKLDLMRQGIVAGDDRYDTLVAQAEQLYEQQRLLDSIMARQQQMIQLGREIGQSFSDAFFQAITGAKSLKEVMVDMLQSIAQAIYKHFIETQIINFFGMLFSGGLGGGTKGVGPVASGAKYGKMLGFAMGGAFSYGNVIPFAKGGIVNQPTMFKFAQGAGLMGEAGPEAIMPLGRMANGKLGVYGAGGNVTHIHVEVHGSAGTPEQNNDLAVKVANKLKGTMDAQVDERIQYHMRSGGMFNRGVAV